MILYYLVVGSPYRLILMPYLQQRNIDFLFSSSLGKSYSSLLQRSFQELKLRYEEKERILASNASLSCVALQGSSQSRRSDFEMGHAAAKKDHKLLSQNLIVIV